MMANKDLLTYLVRSNKRLKDTKIVLISFNKIEHLRTTKVDSIKTSTMMDSMRRVRFQMQKRLRNSGKEFGEKKKSIIKMQNGS